MPFDPELFGQAMGEAIRKAVAPLEEKIADLEARLKAMPEPTSGKDGEPGRDGKDCDMEQVRAWVNDAVSAIPPPKDGKDGVDGKDGKSITVDDVMPMLKELTDDIRREAYEAINEIEDRVSKLPTPKDGKDGKDGRDGKDGADGKSFTIEEADKLLDARMARWELDFERRANETLQRAIDRIPAPKDGAPGKDGSDGVGFDDLCVEHDGERAVALVFTKGERVKRFDLTLPLVIDRGIYRPDMDIEAGDGVTWGGSYWIAQKDAPTGKPGEPGSDGWRLAVKRGRDGKDGRNGIDKTAPVRIEA